MALAIKSGQADEVEEEEDNETFLLCSFRHAPRSLSTSSLTVTHDFPLTVIVCACSQGWWYRNCRPGHQPRRVRRVYD